MNAAAPLPAVPPRGRRPGRLPLDRYVGRGEISSDQHRAGLRLWRDYLAARERSVASGDPARIRAGGSPRMADISALLDARARCRAALAAAGPVLAPVLLHVACLEESAGSWAESIGRPPRRARTEGLITLRLALDALAIHYGLAGPARPGAVSTWSLPTAPATA
ncbi:MAG: hypothetical protein J0H82_35660 [Alphaproteobacteria bacterium]|jgi:hypothetical protein|nr:hypothetical protein [Alphaproteobacteria bacterium]